MALNWKWNDKVGEMNIIDFTGEERAVSLYEGNAYIIMLNQWKENDEEYWSMYGFWNDEKDMKICLEQKGTDTIIGFSFDKKKLKKTKLRKMVSTIVDTFDEITIKIY